MNMYMQIVYVHELNSYDFWVTPPKQKNIPWVYPSPMDWEVTDYWSWNWDARNVRIHGPPFAP